MLLMRWPQREQLHTRFARMRRGGAKRVLLPRAQVVPEIDEPPQRERLLGRARRSHELELGLERQKRVGAVLSPHLAIRREVVDRFELFARQVRDAPKRRAVDELLELAER